MVTTVVPPPGFDASHVAPTDAAVAIKSLRRRFAEAFGRAPSTAELFDAAADGLAPLDHAAATAAALDQIRSALRQVMIVERPTVALPSGSAVPAGAGSSGPEVVLARLGEAAEELAEAMGEVHGDAWLRTGAAGTGEVNALDVARLAVQISIDHLHAAERAIDRADD